MTFPVESFTSYSSQVLEPKTLSATDGRTYGNKNNFTILNSIKKNIIYDKCIVFIITENFIVNVTGISFDIS